MRFKQKFKSCLWSRTDIWGDLLSKQNSLLRPKWDRILGILSSQWRLRRPLVGNRNKRRRQNTSFVPSRIICHNYDYVKPRTRANQVFKYNRWGFRNTLSTLSCLRRFYGDLNHSSFKNFSLCRFQFKKSSQKLLRDLERRLDVTLYRLGFFHSVFYSRQAIQHNKVLVNGKKIGFGGFVLQKGDIVEFCPSQRAAVRARLLARYKNFRSFYVRMERYRMTPRYKIKLHLQPTPKGIQTDYPSLSFVVSSEAAVPVIFPFRANVDEALWSAKYGYR